MASYFVFNRDGVVWTSPNVSYLPSNTPLVGSNPHETITPSVARIPNFAYAAFPSIPYTPRSPLLAGDLFGRLSYKFHTLPIDLVGRRWMLRATVHEQWDELERCLLHANEVLLSNLSMKDAFFGVDTEAYRLPSQWGYKSSFLTATDARHTIWRSRNAFLVMGGITSMFISIHLHRKPLQHDSFPSWACLLVSAGMQETWVDDLPRSFVVNFNIERASVFIRASQELGWLCQLPNMISANVPVWIYWSDPLQRLPQDNTILLKYQPRYSERSRLLFVLENLHPCSCLVHMKILCGVHLPFERLATP